MDKHMHEYKEDGIYLICSVPGCENKKLKLSNSEENPDLLIGQKSNGMKYSVRKHRKAFFMPEVWLKVMDQLTSKRAKDTAEMLIQTGARINEIRYIEKRDFDWDRNTVRLRVTKTKARKKGEERGSPRTLPLNSDFIKKIKKDLKDAPDNQKLNFLSTCAFDIALHLACKRIGLPDWYMYSAHSIRKTHGNWLKVLGNAKVMNVDAMEICLRLGHDYNTFLKDYGSTGVMNEKDINQAKKILGDLYEVK
jgi:integrase